MDRDLAYLKNLIATGQEFTYRRARAQHEFDPMLEASEEKWTEWMTMAEMAVKTFAARDSEAPKLIRDAKHLEVVGQIADEFYKSRELALSALRMCARYLGEPTHSKSTQGTTQPETRPTVVDEPRNSPLDREVKSLQSSGEENVDPAFWDHYGKPIMIGAAATVVGGLLLAFLL